MEGRKREVESSREGRRREKDKGCGEMHTSTCIPLVAKYRLWFVDKQADIPGHRHVASE